MSSRGPGVYAGGFKQPELISLEVLGCPRVSERVDMPGAKLRVARDLLKHKCQERLGHRNRPFGVHGGYFSPRFNIQKCDVTGLPYQGGAWDTDEASSNKKHLGALITGSVSEGSPVFFSDCL